MSDSLPKAHPGGIHQQEATERQQHIDNDCVKWKVLTCKQVKPCFVAFSSDSAYVVLSTGGFSRKLPMGGSAKGMPCQGTTSQPSCPTLPEKDKECTGEAFKPSLRVGRPHYMRTSDCNLRRRNVRQNRYKDKWSECWQMHAGLPRKKESEFDEVSCAVEKDI